MLSTCAFISNPERMSGKNFLSDFDFQVCKMHRCRVCDVRSGGDDTTVPMKMKLKVEGMFMAMNGVTKTKMNVVMQ